MAVLAVLAAVIAANMLGVASAEAPTTTSARTVSVEGVASVPINVNASHEEANATYRQGMASAMSDAQNKAEFLAAKAGATLGQVQSVAERGGSISCSGGESEDGYTPYDGERPDFGEEESGGFVRSAEAAPTAPSLKSASKPTPKKKPKKKKKKTAAKTAAAVSCSLEAQVGLVYALQ